MSKHLWIVELKHLPRNNTLLVSLSGVIIFLRVSVAVDYLRLYVASTNIIIGTTMDRGDDQSSGKDGALMIMSP